MALPIVHVGYHKTATTWFQRSFYPHVRSHAYIPRERVSRAFLSAGAFHFDAEWSRAQLALPPNNSAILCEEALCGPPYTGGHMGLLSAEVARRIRAVLPGACVVLFTRAQPEMIASTYLQYVRMGGTHAPARFLWPDDYRLASDHTPNRTLRFAFEHFEYDRLIAHYVELFGANRVRVYAYEELRDGGRTFLDRFARELELDIDLPGLPMARRNVAFGRRTARLARLLNHFTAHKLPDKRVWLHLPHWYSARKKLLRWIRERGLDGGGSTPEALFGEATTRWIQQRYWESNRRLAKFVPSDLAAHGYALGPPPDHVPLPELPRWRRWLAQ